MSTGELPPAPRFPAPESGAGRRRVRQRALTRDAVVDAAMAIVDNEGLDALTMRTLAHTLGTGAASLYAHVASKDELIDLLAERVIGEFQFHAPPDPDHWEEQIKTMAREMRAVYARHGDLARASFGRIPLGENALAQTEWMLSVLRAGGISDRAAGLACDLLALYIAAISYEESLHAGQDVTPEQVGEFVAQMRDYFASVPVARFPNVVALAGELTDADADERFDFGLDVMLAGLKALSER